MSLTEEKITLEQMPQLFVELKGEILGIKEMIAALGGSSGNRRWGWGPNDLLHNPDGIMLSRGARH